MVNHHVSWVNTQVLRPKKSMPHGAPPASPSWDPDRADVLRDEDLQDCHENVINKYSMIVAIHV